MRLQRLELIPVSHNGTFTTLDIISPGFDRFRPPSRSDPAPGFRLGDAKVGYGTPEIARPKSSPPPATRHACVHYKNLKIRKNEKSDFSNFFFVDL